MLAEQDERVQIGLRLVHSTARRFTGAAVEREDLVGAGMVAIAEALHRAPSVPAFVSYASIRIDGAMREEYRKSVGLLSRDERRLARRIAHAADQLRAEHGREPDTAELAKRTGISEDVVEQTRVAAERHSGWDAARPSGDLERRGTADPLPSLFPHQLQRALARMDARLRSVIVMRFFHDREEKDIGRQLGVSEGRASQLIRNAIRALRAELGEESQ
jgi:DNA-directed RNA polymerase specialized sigma subunit